MGKHFDKNTPSSAPQARVGLAKDVDWHNQRLWKRQQYKEQIKKNDAKKTYREYKKIKDDNFQNETAVDPK